MYRAVAAKCTPCTVRLPHAATAVVGGDMLPQQAASLRSTIGAPTTPSGFGRGTLSEICHNLKEKLIKVQVL